jgi:hypothetical protein
LGTGPNVENCKILNWNQNIAWIKLSNAEPAVVLNGQEPPNKFKRFHQLALLVFVDSPQEAKDFASVLDIGVKL